MNSATKTNRMELVDALRGFAILCIVLLHNMERFEFHYSLQNLPLWVKYLDKKIMFSAYFLFGGEAYAIFALLFGFGLYKYTGAFYGLFIGITLFFINLAFCKWWLKTHMQGPLEYLWYKATWVGFGKNNVA